MIRSFRGVRPTIASSAYVDESAQVIGDVVIGDESSVWMNAVVRGDVNTIRGPVGMVARSMTAS